jgi:RNA polymerase sigma-70 factor (ECF subfamily)
LRFVADLTQSFMVGVADAYRLETEVATRLGPLLTELLTEARDAWPTVELSGEEFAKHLASVAPDVEDVAAELRRLKTADLYLACACSRGDAAAVRAFEERIMPGAKRAAARIDGEPAFIEEVCSDVRVRLLTAASGPPRIASYLGHGPLVHWVQVAAMRTAQTRKRKQKVHRFTILDDMEETAGGADPELAPLAAQIQQPFGVAFSEALAELSPRERNVLRLYLIDEISAEKIGSMYRVHRATVARWIAAARRKVYVATRKRLARNAGIEPTSFESLMGHVLSGMELSLASFLQE